MKVPLRKLPGRLLGEILCLPVRAYRIFISPWKPRTCRFVPSCSEYFLQAVRIRGPLVGPLLGILRILRCHPFGGCGFDPVPRKGWRYREEEEEVSPPPGEEPPLPPLSEGRRSNT